MQYDSIGHVPLVGIFGDMDIRVTLFERLLHHKASVSSTRQQHVRFKTKNKLGAGGVPKGNSFLHPTGPLEQVCLTSLGQRMPKEGRFVAGFGIAKLQPQLTSVVFCAHFIVLAR